MKRLVLAFLLVTNVFFSFSKEVDIEEAKLVAKKFLKVSSKADLIVDEAIVFQEDKSALTYVINFKPEGWAIVSADDRAQAILAYSNTGHFDTKEVKSLPFYFWFKGYADQISVLISSKAPENPDPSWNEINTSKYTKAVTPVEPLIAVEWNQSAGWNEYCPVAADGPGGHVYAGCVAVAMAQCMSVYKYPSQGYGSYSYNHEIYGTQFANFGETTYDWANMTDKGATDAVALLLYHLGVSVNMGYGADGSGAYSTAVPGAIKKYFGYSSSAQYLSRDNYTDEGEWEAILIDQLKNGNPIYYSGDGGDGQAGHAFNIDGVNSNGAFHFNFGWSGSYNGYYFVTGITPGSNNFTYDQGAVINFMPRDNAPQDITLSKNTVEEGMPIGTIIGKINVTDETPDDAFTFEVSGTEGFGGEQLSVPFTELEGNLVTTEVLDHSYLSRYEIVIKATDKTNLSYEKNLFVNVDPNSAPKNITLTSITMYDTTSVGTYIGKLTTTDSDAGDNFTYTFENNEDPLIGKDNGKFILTNDSLFVNYDFTNFEGTECSLYIKTADKLDESFSKEIKITVNKTTGSFEIAEMEENISIYPNPSSDGKFNVSFEGLQAEVTNKPVSLIIYNTIGAVVKTYNGYITQDMTLDIPTKGLFIMNITVGEYSISKKIINQ